MDQKASRRAFLAGAAGLALAGCAGDPSAMPSVSATSIRSSARATTASGTPPVSSATTPSVTPTPTPTPTQIPALPSRAAIVEKYGHVVPHEWGLETTGLILRTTPEAASAHKIALTFDACGGPHGSGYDDALIATLRKLQVPATLMLNTRWVQANATLAKELGADPLFEIQSHGTAHKPLSVSGQHAYGIAGTTNVDEVYDELTGGLEILNQIARRPVRFFRAGTAYSDEVAAAVARELGLPVVNFSVNADAGATFSAAQVAGALQELSGGDIVIAHMNQPSSGTAAGFAQALPGLLERGLVFAHLSDVAR